VVHVFISSCCRHYLVVISLLRFEFKKLYRNVQFKYILSSDSMILGPIRKKDFFISFVLLEKVTHNRKYTALFTCVMALENCKSTFEDLSAELFYEIFDYFRFHELYQSFSNLNHRIDDYLAQLSNIFVGGWSYQDPLTITANLNDKQISNVKSIKFSTWRREEQHVMREFFIQYPLQSFQQLRSLLISITSNIEFPLIINQLPLLPSLTLLNIEFNLFQRLSDLTIHELRHACETIICHCSTLKALTLLILCNLHPRKKIHTESIFTQSMTTNIKYFYIRQIYFEEFDYILSPTFLPQIKSLHVSLYYLQTRIKFRDINGLILNSLVNLGVGSDVPIELACIESILKRTPNLQTLSISSSTAKFIDCQKWEYFVSKYLQKIEAFRLNARDYERNWSKSHEFLDFQTSTFWSRERAGTIQTKCEEKLDVLDTEIDSLTVIFTTMTFKNANTKRNCLFH